MSPRGEPILVREIQWKPIPKNSPIVTSAQKAGSGGTKMVHYIAPQTSKVTHHSDEPTPSQQHIHHHYYHYPDGRTEMVSTPSNVSPKEPIYAIPNPQENIQVASGFQKVITTQPDSSTPDEAPPGNNSLKNLREKSPLITENGPSIAASKSPIIKQPKSQKRAKKIQPDKKYKFKKTLRTEEIDKAIPCPIEDPRNPYHQEYLKLKAMSDGHLKEASMLSQTPSYTTNNNGLQYSNNTDVGPSRHASRTMDTSIYNAPIREHKQQKLSPNFKSKTMTILPNEVIAYQKAPLSSKAMNNGEVYGDPTPTNTPSEHELENEENITPVQNYAENYQNYQIPQYQKPQVVTQIAKNFDYCDDCDVAFTKKPSLEPAIGRSNHNINGPQIQGMRISRQGKGPAPVMHHVNTGGYVKQRAY